MTDSDNVAGVRRFADAFNRRDFERVVTDLDPDVELHEWPMAPGAGSYRGHDGVRQAIASWFESWEWMQIDIEDFVEYGDRVLVTLHHRAQGKGSAVEVEIRSSNVFTFHGGKAIRIQLFTEREPALEAAGLTPNYEEEKR